MSLEADETGNLIGSDKVEGTAVYGADNNKIGSIERVMIDKKSGKVSYAVLSFRRLSRHRRRPLSAALAIAEIRYLARRLRHRRDGSAAQGRAALRQRQRLELERPDQDPRRQRLLRRRDLIAVTP